MKSDNISNLKNVRAWEKHWKEGREGEIYKEGQGFETYHDR